MTEPCPDCVYARQERSGMFMNAGHDQRASDTLAAQERCPEHSVLKPKQRPLAQWLADNPIRK